MAKKTRQPFKLFGDSGATANFGQFGSKVASGGLNTKDIPTIQALTAWLDGLQDSVYGANKAPFLEEMNALFYVLAYQLFYLFQDGIPDWDSATTYYIGSIVKKPGTTPAVYISLTNNNTNQALPGSGNNGNWYQIIPTQAGDIVGQIVAAQITSLATSQLTGLIVDGQIDGMSAVKLIGLVVNGQINSVDAGKITSQIVNSQIQSMDAAKLTGTVPIGNGTITRAKLSTGTGSVSGSGGSTVDITMQDYNFFPSILTHAGRDTLGSFASTDLGDTVGRFSKGNSQAYDIRWRYITSSDNPRIWAVVTKDGDIRDVWESEDPPNHADIADFGDPEICPFKMDESADGLKIVRIAVPSLEEIAEFTAHLKGDAKMSHFERSHRRISAKGWIKPDAMGQVRTLEEIASLVPSEKKDMARHWMLRALAGRATTSEMIRKIFKYSVADERIYLNTDHADSLTPQGFSAKNIRGVNQ